LMVFTVVKANAQTSRKKTKRGIHRREVKRIMPRFWKLFNDDKPNYLKLYTFDLFPKVLHWANYIITISPFFRYF
jgi:hypothetical protein